jgi:hypothetical protein
VLEREAIVEQGTHAVLLARRRLRGSPRHPTSRTSAASFLAASSTAGLGGVRILRNVLRSVWWKGSGCRHRRHRVLLIGPRSIGVDRHVEGATLGPKRVLQKRSRNDAVGDGPADCLQPERLGVGGGVTGEHGHLSARDGEGQEQRAGGRLPEPMADLVVKGLDLVGLDDARVVAQPYRSCGPLVCASMGCNCNFRCRRPFQGRPPWD